MPTKIKATLARCSALVFVFSLLLSSSAFTANEVGAPLIKRVDRQIITHMGKIVDEAMPGDSIEYIAEYTNVGKSAAKNVTIGFDVPNGTTYMARTVSIKKGAMPKTILFLVDPAKNTWVEKYKKAEDVRAVKCVVDSVPPTAKGPSGVISIKVIVNM